MKIAITADLHYSITSPTNITQLAQGMLDHQPDVVVIAGDVAEVLVDIDLFSDCLNIFSSLFKCPILVLAGNHDLWVKDNNAKINSIQLWDSTLEELTKNAGCIWLEHRNWKKDSVAIVGSYLHYDFSAKDIVGPMAQLPIEYFIVNKAKIINDGNFMHGLPDDVEFARQIGTTFIRKLKAAQNDRKIKHIVIVTHVPCLEQQMTRRPHDQEWAIATPYFGNLSHQKDILSCDKVKFVISGHSHRPEEAIISRGQKPDIAATVIGSDYHDPKCKIIEI